MDDITLLKLNDEFFGLDFDGKWRQIGQFYLEIKNWSQEEQSHSMLFEVCDG